MGVLYSDNFNRGNSTGLGANWVAATGQQLDVSNSQAMAGTGTATWWGSNYDAASLSTEDSQYVEATVSPPNIGHAGVTLWADSYLDPGVSGTGYYLMVDGLNVGIYEISGGSVVNPSLVEASVGGEAFYRLAWDPLGNLLATRNGVEILSVTDATTLLPSTTGLLAYSDSATTGAWFDDFAAGTLSNAVEISPTLDSLWNMTQDRQWLQLNPVNNTLWAMQKSSYSTSEVYFSYSTDYGQTWTNAPSLTIPKYFDGMGHVFRSTTFHIDDDGVGYVALIDQDSYMRVYATSSPAPDLSFSMSSVSTWSHQVTAGNVSVQGPGSVPIYAKMKAIHSYDNRKSLQVFAMYTPISGNGWLKRYGASWQGSSLSYAFTNVNNDSLLPEDKELIGHFDFDLYQSSPSAYPRMTTIRIDSSRRVETDYYVADSGVDIFNSIDTGGPYLIDSATFPSDVTDAVSCKIIGSQVLFAWVMGGGTPVGSEINLMVCPLESDHSTASLIQNVPALDDREVTGLEIVATASEWRVYAITQSDTYAASDGVNGNLWTLAIDKYSGEPITDHWIPLEIGNIVTYVATGEPRAGDMVFRLSPAVSRATDTGVVPIGFVEERSGTWDTYQMATFDTNPYAGGRYVTLAEINATYGHTAMLGTRSVDTGPDGTTWVLVADDELNQDRLFWTTDGASFTEYEHPLSRAHTVSNIGDLFVDYANRVWYTYVSGGTTGYVYRIDDKNTAPQLQDMAYDYGADATSMVVFEDPEVSGNYVLARLIQYYSGSTVYLTTALFDASHAKIVEQVVSTTGMSSQPDIALDFKHTGDGKTATSSPDLHMMYFDDADGTSLSIFAYDGQSQYRYGASWPAVVRLDTTDMQYGDRLSGYFDGTRTVVAYTDATSDSEVQIVEYDGSATQNDPPALSDGVLAGPLGGGVSISYDLAGNIILVASGSTSYDVSVCIYDRNLDSWSAWDVVPASVKYVSGYPGSSLSTPRRVTDRNTVPIVWTNSDTPPFAQIFYDYSVDVAPYAPVLTLPAAGNRNVGTALGFAWIFDDANSLDYQTSYSIKRVVGGTTHYWNAITESWSVSEFQNISTATKSFLPANWATPSATTQDFSVKVWDSTGLSSDYSTPVTVLPATRHDPTVTNPTYGLSFRHNVISEVLVEWTVDSQSEYRVIFRDADTNDDLHDTGWVVDTDARSYSIPVEGP